MAATEHVPAVPADVTIAIVLMAMMEHAHVVEAPLCTKVHNPHRSGALRLRSGARLRVVVGRVINSCADW